MWKEIKDFIAQLGSDDDDTTFEPDQLRLASAALLVYAVMVDGRADPIEMERLEALLMAHYELDPAEARDLIKAARAKEQEAVDLYGFTSVITRQLGQSGRKKIVEMLWEIVFADGIEHEFESNLVWRTAELLGVSTQDRIALKQKVKARNGIQ